MEEKSEVEQRVLRAARRLFVAQGVAKTPLRAIAAEAGSSESGVLRFFRDKDDLARAVMDSCWVEVNDQMSEALRVQSRSSDDPRFLLVEVVRALLEHALADKQTVAFRAYAIFTTRDRPAPTRSSRRTIVHGSMHTVSIDKGLDELCGRCVAHAIPGLSEAGITQSGLCHLTLSRVHGVIGGWYLSEQDPVVHGHPVSLEDALAVLRRVVYVNGS